MIPSTTSLTTSKCGLPKKMDLFRDHEFEWTTRVGTLTSSFRRPLDLPLGNGQLGMSDVFDQKERGSRVKNYGTSEWER